MAKGSGAGAGPNGGSSGNRIPGRSLNPRLTALLALGLLVQGLVVSAAAQTPPPEPPVVVAPSNVEFRSRTAERDSLMQEIKSYSEMIRTLRDSLTGRDLGLDLSDDQKLRLQGNIDEISQVVDRIGDELSRMDFEIKNNRISLVNEAGEGIVINVPEDLDAQVSQGIKALTQVILSELPDSTGFDRPKRWDWNRFRTEAPPPERRIINGNIVKVGQDVHISAKEDVRGNVVVIFGNAEISGRVDGDVVTVLGHLLLDEDAEVTGSVVTVGGYLDQDPGADVEDVTAIDPLGRGRGEGWAGLLRHDGVSFLICQGMFILTLVLAVGAVLLTPRARFDAVSGALRGNPLGSFGMGLTAAVVGHLVISVLAVVLIISVIGIPLALLVGLALVVIAALAVAVSGAVLGGRICQAVTGDCRAPWLAVAVGLVALHAVSFLGSVFGLVGIPDPLASLVVLLGATIKILAYAFGLGALLISRFGKAAPAA